MYSKSHGPTYESNVWNLRHKTNLLTGHVLRSVYGQGSALEKIVLGDVSHLYINTFNLVYSKLIIQEYWETAV